jgi:hypothetical protein
VLTAVQFDHQTMLMAAKVDDVRSYGNLAPKLHSQQPAATKPTPKPGFCIRHVATQAASSRGAETRLAHADSLLEFLS